MTWPVSHRNPSLSDVRAVGEIVLPETKPETEWILDRPVQELMPTTDHSILQLALQWHSKPWASPPGEDIRPVVPDVAFMSFARFRPLSPKDRKTPPVAPEIVVEILSPDDRQKDVDEKRRVSFAGGVMLGLIADPDGRVESYSPPDHPEPYPSAASDVFPNSIFLRSRADGFVK